MTALAFRLASSTGIGHEFVVPGRHSIRGRGVDYPPAS
jgi:hypothetical protein